jgi:hypothetical protein
VRGAFLSGVTLVCTKTNSGLLWRRASGGGIAVTLVQHKHHEVGIPDASQAGHSGRLWGSGKLFGATDGVIEGVRASSAAAEIFEFRNVRAQKNVHAILSSEQGRRVVGRHVGRS